VVLRGSGAHATKTRRKTSYRITPQAASTLRVTHASTVAYLQTGGRREGVGSALTAVLGLGFPLQAHRAAAERAAAERAAVRQLEAWEEERDLGGPRARTRATSAHEKRRTPPVT
jgi:hypothetical protein